MHISDTHAASIHGNDFLVEAFEAPLALRDQLWCKRAVTVARRSDFLLVISFLLFT